MKRNILVIAALLLSGSLFFSSCTKDNSNAAAPVITLAPITTAYTVASGDSVAVVCSLTIVADGKISTFAVSEKNGTTTTTVPVTSSDFKDKTSAKSSYSKYWKYSAVDATLGVTITFSVTDANNNKTEKTITVTRQAAAQGGAINNYTATILGGNTNTTLGSYYATTNNTVYNTTTSVAASSLIDFIYYYGTSNSATITAPTDVTVNGGTGNLTLAANLSPKNATTFATTTLTTTDFAAITNDTQIAAITTYSDTKETQLAVGQVFAFKTAAGKKGLVNISAINGTASGSITINVKVQQ